MSEETVMTQIVGAEKQRGKRTQDFNLAPSSFIPEKRIPTSKNLNRYNQPYLTPLQRSLDDKKQPATFDLNGNPAIFNTIGGLKKK